MAVKPGLVEEALEAVIVDSPYSFYWFGKRVGALPQKIRKAVSAAGMRHYLRHNLRARLYRDFYCRGRAVPTEDVSSSHGPVGLTPFLIGLSVANAGSGSRETGWMVHAIEDGRVVVQRNGLSIWVDPDQIYAAPSEKLRAGEQRDVRFPKELLNQFPGFYMALGDQGLAQSFAMTVVRFYWNLRSDGASRLMTAATRHLNSSKIPFQLKVLNHPDLYNRCDAGVLYVYKPDYPQVAHIVRRLYSELGGYLKPDTPVFTKQLAPGLAVAESPPDLNVSFGNSRCGLLAEGIIRVHEQTAGPLSTRMEIVAASFRDAEVNLELPFLNSGSIDDYGFPSL
jgi:hypothetical protein